MAGKAKAREANEHHRPGRWLRDRATEDELASINHGLCANPCSACHHEGQQRHAGHQYARQN
jgi:hypothetical protein